MSERRLRWARVLRRAHTIYLDLEGAITRRSFRHARRVGRLRRACIREMQSAQSAPAPWMARGTFNALD